MNTDNMQLPANVRELEALLPILKEKETAGLILPSYDKARSLINWAKTRTLTEKQSLFIGRLILRAKRKHVKDKRFNNLTAALNAPVTDVNAVAAKVMELLGEDKDNAVDVEAIVTRCTETAVALLEKRVPRKVQITVQQGVKGKAINIDGPHHMMFEKLLRAANTRLPNGYAPGIFLSGEASSGKTTGSKMVAEALKLKWYFNGAISMPHEMLGFIDANGKYHTTPFRQAYEFGGVYTFDEVDRSDPNALLAVNPHLANGVATFPDKQIKRHPDCIIICTANTWGLAGSSDYSGATKLDAAFLSRFPVRIGWDIDPVLEEKIVDHAEWLARVRTVRGRARAVGLKVMIDTRIAQAGAALIASGFTMDEAAEMTYLANMKPEQRKQVEG